MRLDDHPLVQRVIVEEGADVADDWIYDQVQEDDIVVTNDIPLAARVMEKSAVALRPNGKPFTPDNISMALAMRELNQELRETGVIKGHNPSFTKADKSNFLQELEDIIQGLIRKN